MKITCSYYSILNSNYTRTSFDSVRTTLVQQSGPQGQSRQILTVYGLLSHYHLLPSNHLEPQCFIMPKHQRLRNAKGGIIPRPVTNEDPNACGENGVRHARAELQGYLTKSALSIARTLKIQRGYDWTTDQSGRAIEQVAYTDVKRTAAVLHRRGVVAAQPCRVCQSSVGSRAWQSCVVSPTVDGTVFQRGSCSNCLFNHRGYACSHRLDLESAGSSAGRHSVHTNV
ncbi:hypothetical protein BJY00DRAFT_49003 [Aspergillus carlsbadensis]|nr:hypothetical protein BJY00DRAFT_49003 [Aspergillus carlsbadensis]